MHSQASSQRLVWEKESWRAQGSAEVALAGYDAVCINRRDILERNQQIKLISQIYGTAKVVVWLGPEADESNLAFKVLHHPTEDDPDMLETTEQGFVAFIHPLNRDYFEFMWIIQEISIPGDVTPNCGLLSEGFRAAEDINNYSLPIRWHSGRPKDNGDDDEIPSPAYIALLSRVQEQVNKSLTEILPFTCRTLRRYPKLFVA